MAHSSLGNSIPTPRLAIGLPRFLLGLVLPNKNTRTGLLGEHTVTLPLTTGTGNRTLRTLTYERLPVTATLTRMVIGKLNGLTPREAHLRPYCGIRFM